MKSILKFLSVCIILFQCLNLKSQSGLNCTNAISVNSFSVCNYLNYSTTGTEMWFKFVAQSKDVNVSVNTSKYGIDIAHIHNISLYSGNCSVLNFVTDDELPFEFNAKELNIDMNASGLVIGNTYYLKLNRKALHDDCDKLNCKAGSSTATAYFSMCIENIDVLVPPDFGIEQPSIAHFYEQNRGQLIDNSGNLVPQVKLYTKSTSPAVYIGDNFTSFVFSKIDTIASTIDSIHRVDMTLVNANINTRVFKTEQLPSVNNYYLAHIPQGITNNKSFYRSVINEIYPKIDLQHYSNNDGFKFYFVIRPGGDANLIKLKFDGATSTATTSTGGLKIVTSLGDIVFEKPHVYRINPANNIVPMPSSGDFIKTGVNEYQVYVQNYPPNMPVIIQIDRGHTMPNISAATDNLSWSTYYGASDGEDSGQSIKNDNSGNTYVGGYSTTPNFPTSTGAYQTTFVSGDLSNGVLMKFNTSRQRQWATYYGGSAEEQIRSISFDNSSNQIYASGHTWSSNFPIINKSGATNSPLFQGIVDAFITSFNASNGFATWSNLIGTTGDDRSFSVCTDNSGNKYLVGQTANGLTLSNTASYYIQNTYAGGNTDGFIAKFNSTDQLRWLTYYGGNMEDYPKSVTTDASGNIIVWGTTASTSFNTFDADPINHTAIYNTTNSGQSDFFIIKFNSSGARLWATLYGGSLDEWAADADGVVTVGNDIYCFGTTFSNNLPIQQFGSTATYNLNGTQDCYIVCFNSSYQAKWATYFGSSSEDWAGGITKDNNNNIFITGATQNSDYVVASQTGFYNSSFQGPSGGNGNFIGGDAFITAFANNSFAPVWSTFIGGNKNEAGISICELNNTLFITGSTTSSPNNSTVLYPVVDPGNSAYIYTPVLKTGISDIFISEFNITNMSTQVGIHENIKNNLDVNIYPNPFTNKINIKGIKEKSSIEVFDTTGKLVFSDILKAEESNVNLTIQSSGIYLLRISNDNGDYKTFKIIKD